MFPYFPVEQLLVFFSTYSWCPRSWTFILMFFVVHYYTIYIYSITQSTTRFYGFCCENKVWPWMLMTCLTHGESTHNLGVLFIGLMFLHVLASTGSGTSTWYISYDFRTNFLYIIYSETRVLSKILSPLQFEPWPPLISTVNDLKAEGLLSESLCGVQLEVGQSAVVKPPFEPEYDAQQSSHHPLFLSPNSKVTVMSYQDRSRTIIPYLLFDLIIPLKESRGRNSSDFKAQMRRAAISLTDTGFRIYLYTFKNLI